MEKFLAVLGKVRRDKLLHVVAGVVVFAGAAPVAVAFGFDRSTGVMAALILGAVKEAYDAAYNRWVAPTHQVDWNDTLATYLGGVLGMLCASCDTLGHWLSSALAFA